MCWNGTSARLARHVFQTHPPSFMPHRSVRLAFASRFGALQGGISVCLVALSACGGPPAGAPGAARPPAVPEDVPEAPAAPAPDAPLATLPESVTGTFDVSLDQCAPAMTTMARLTLTPDSLLFYYGYATVETVTPRDGGFDVEAALVLQEGVVEVRPAPATYRIETDDDGRSLRLSAPSGGGEPSALVRCP